MPIIRLELVLGFFWKRLLEHYSHVSTMVIVIIFSLLVFTLAWLTGKWQATPDFIFILILSWEAITHRFVHFFVKPNLYFRSLFFSFPYCLFITMTQFYIFLLATLLSYCWSPLDKFTWHRCPFLFSLMMDTDDKW